MSRLYKDKWGYKEDVYCEGKDKDAYFVDKANLIKSNLLSESDSLRNQYRSCQTPNKYSSYIHELKNKSKGNITKYNHLLFYNITINDNLPFNLDMKYLKPLKGKSKLLSPTEYNRAKESIRRELEDTLVNGYTYTGALGIKLKQTFEKQYEIYIKNLGKKRNLELEFEYSLLNLHFYLGPYDLIAEDNSLYLFFKEYNKADIYETFNEFANTNIESFKQLNNDYYYPEPEWMR